jgi:hypothetical protein
MTDHHERRSDMYPYDLQFIKAETAYRTARAAELMGPASGPSLRRLRAAVRDLVARRSSRRMEKSAHRAVGVDMKVPQHVS